MGKKKGMTALIHRYLSAQATPEEKQLMERWLLESADHREMFEQIKLIWDHSEEDTIAISDSEMHEGLRRLEETIAAKVKEELHQGTEWAISHGYLKRVYKNLAILALLIISCLSVWAFYAQYKLTIQEITISGKREILLPDNTEIFSNKATVVSFRQTLWKRQVQLEGEAFFEVQRDERRPFVIHASETTIEVLGTSFLVRAYPGSPVQVSVVSGTVAVSHKDQRVEIQTGEEVMVAENDKLIISQSIDPNNLAWKTGRLSFSNSTVEKALSELARMYDVKFEVEDPAVLSCPFTGRFDNLALNEALDVLTFSLHMTVDYIDHKVIKLSGKGNCR